MFTSFHFILFLLLRLSWREDHKCTFPALLQDTAAPHCWVLPLPEMTWQGCSSSPVPCFSLLLCDHLSLPQVSPDSPSPSKDGCPHCTLLTCRPTRSLLLHSHLLLWLVNGLSFSYGCVLLPAAWCPGFPAHKAHGWGQVERGGYSTRPSWWGTGRGCNWAATFFSCLVFAKTA